ISAATPTKDAANTAADRRRPLQSLARFFLSRTVGLTAARLNGWGLSFCLTAVFHASAQCIHQVNDFRWRSLSRCLDLLTGLLLLQKLLQRVLVLVFKFLRLEVTRFCFDDV